ncbi:hypothetical protein [Hydrogenophaga sp. ANAO-22]|uniref:hypothetical protein n=1 Tax=Hydrogenophaga sp. ANAO-22 TaxID=3166645 RepID=UPI0036D2E9EA
MKTRLLSFAVPLAGTLFMLGYLLYGDFAPSMRGLDLSWHVMLGYAHENKLQHGSQILFNYGPLSFIESVIYFEQSHQERLLYKAAFLLMVGIGCFLVLQIRSAGALLAWGGLTLLMGIWRDVYLLLPALLLCHHECRRQQGHAAQLALSVLLAFAAAFACLVKANALFFTLPALVLASLYRFTVRDYRPIVPVCFVLSFVLLFWLSGQDVSGVFAFLRGYVDVSLAYNADMGLPAPFALHGAYIVGAAVLLAATLRMTHPASTVLSLLTLGYLLVAYKMGFVRHGANPGASFLALALLCAVQLGSPSVDVPTRYHRRVIAAVAMAAALLVIHISASLLPQGATSQDTSTLWRIASAMCWTQDTGPPRMPTGAVTTRRRSWRHAQPCHLWALKAPSMSSPSSSVWLTRRGCRSPRGPHFSPTLPPAATCRRATRISSPARRLRGRWFSASCPSMAATQPRKIRSPWEPTGGSTKLTGRRRTPCC